MLQILNVILTCLSYPFSIFILVKERYYLLPSVPPSGHGVVLLLFWSLEFIVENLAFINLRHEDWWFHWHSPKDTPEMAFFVLRYISGLFIFIVGLKAPGIVRHFDESLIDENAVSGFHYFMFV